MIAKTAILTTGKLKEFNQAGVLSLADVHLAKALTSLCGEPSEDVALAAALTMRAWRTGSPCLDVRRAKELSVDLNADETLDQETLARLHWPETDSWLRLLEDGTRVVGRPDDDRPLCLTDGLLYLRETWRTQQTVVKILQQRWQASPPDVPACAPVFDPSAPDQGPGPAVLDAVLHHWTHVVVGGPGSGKTTAIGHVVREAVKLDGLHHIAVAAPTNKAASQLAPGCRTAGVIPTSIHTLLGSLGPRRGFRHNADNPLPVDLVIIDEMSMVPLTLMADILQALGPNTRLLLVGDPDQLSSIGAGTVLADLKSSRLTAQAGSNEPLVQILTGSFRPDDGFKELFTKAAAVNDAAAADGDVEAAAENLVKAFQPDHPQLCLVDVDASKLTLAQLTEVATTVRRTARQVIDAALDGNATAALKHLDEHRMLCAHREGPYGVSTWAKQVGDEIETLVNPEDWQANNWFAGRGRLATIKAPELGIVNGSQAVAVRAGDTQKLNLAFDSSAVAETDDSAEDGDVLPLIRQTQLVALDAVPGLVSLDAMTIHKAQGSQFDSVTVILPPSESHLSIRPLIYTAMTRAKSRLTLVGTREQIIHALTTEPVRTSGLAKQLRAQMAAMA